MSINSLNLEQSVATKESQEIIKNKISFFKIVAVIAIIIFLTYSIINFYLQDYYSAIAEVILVFIMLIALILINNPKNYNVAIMLGGIVVFYISVHNFVIGGFGGTGVYWMFVFPPIIYILFGRQKGLYWSYAIVFTILIIYSGYLIGFYRLPYSIFDFVMFILIFIATIALTYFYELIIEKNQTLLQEKSLELEKVSRSLEAVLSRKSIESAEVEKMNDLMIGRELKMEQLKNRLVTLEREKEELTYEKKSCGDIFAELLINEQDIISNLGSYYNLKVKHSDLSREQKQQILNRINLIVSETNKYKQQVERLVSNE